MNKFSLLAILLFLSGSAFGMERNEIVDKLTASKALLNAAILGKTPIANALVPFLKEVMGECEDKHLIISYLLMALKQGAEINYTDEITGLTPLWAAAVRGDINVVKLFLSVPHIFANPFNPKKDIQLIQYLQEMLAGKRELEIGAWYLRKIFNSEDIDSRLLRKQANILRTAYTNDIKAILELLISALPQNSAMPLHFDNLTLFGRFPNIGMPSMSLTFDAQRQLWF